MRFFKYLILIILSFIASTVYAGYRAGSGTCSETKQAACDSALQFVAPDSGHGPATYTKPSGNYCEFFTAKDVKISSSSIVQCETSCPVSGYPAYRRYAYGELVDVTVCEPRSDGKFCVWKWDGSKININDSIKAGYNSVSSIPSSSCTPKKEQSACDPKDPYGDCYQPPDDGCTRQSDGSIICPEDTPDPKPDPTCNGATYCKRPPNGCPAGYVSGSFNGEQLCVKSSPSTDNGGDGDGSGGDGSGGDGDGDGSGGDGSGGDGSGGDGSGGDGSGGDGSGGDGSGGDGSGGDGSGNNGSGIDLSGVISAINNAKNAIVAAVNSVSSKVDTLIKVQKETNDKLNNIDQNIKQTNEKLVQLNEETKKTNSLLQDLKDWFTSDTETPDSGSPVIEQFDIPNYEQSYVKWNSACPADVHVPIHLMGQSSTLVLSWSPWCELLAKLRWAIIACAYFAAAYIILGMR